MSQWKDGFLAGNSRAPGLVTGSSRGIGRAVAAALAALGARVAITAAPSPRPCGDRESGG